MPLLLVASCYFSSKARRYNITQPSFFQPAAQVVSRQPPPVLRLLQLRRFHLIRVEVTQVAQGDLHHLREAPWDGREK